MTDPLSTGLVALVVALYLAAAVTDILWLRIPNVIVVALLGLFTVVAGGAIAGDRIGWGALALHHLLPGFLAFAIGAGLFAAGKMGGGDVKLLGVTFLWGGTGLAPIMLMVLGIAGIVLLVLHLKLVPVLQYLVLRTASALGRQWDMPKALQTTKGLPYALAIAPVGLVLAAHLPLT
jgi:prepilin peptidase CpaA